MCERPNNQAFKNYHLKRYPYCNNCNNKVIKGTCILDHIVRLYDGGTDTIDNTQLLCLGCDVLKTASEVKQDSIQGFIKRAKEMKAGKEHLDQIFESNGRKTKKERAKYNRYLKELKTVKWNEK